MHISVQLYQAFFSMLVIESKLYNTAFSDQCTNVLENIKKGYLQNRSLRVILFRLVLADLNNRCLIAART